MAAPHLLERQRDLAHSGPCTGRCHGELEQVAVPTFGTRRERCERSIARLRIALATQSLEPLDLRAPHGGVVHLEDRHLLLTRRAEAVDADDRLPSRVDPRLRPRCRLLDAE